MDKNCDRIETLINKQSSRRIKLWRTKKNMGNYKRGDNFGGNKGFNNDRGFRGGGRSERPTMHSAVCSDCGKNCEVPFKPTGSKPVFCSDCFGKKGDSGNNRSERRGGGGGGSNFFGDKQMFKAVCDECGKNCEVPFRPTGDKPIYCSDCFGKTERGGGNNSRGGGRNTGSDKYQKQFEMLNSKLDDIMQILSPKSSAKKTPSKEKPVAKVAKKAAKAKAPVTKKKVAVKKKKVVAKKVVKKVAKPSSAKASAGKKKK